MTALAGAALASAVLVSACGGGSGGSSTTAAGTSSSTAKPAFTANSTKITNPYLPISKFHRCVLAGNDGGQQQKIVRTLQSRTQPFTFGGQTVDAAVVSDHVTNVKSGQPIEKTTDYFAQDDAGNVYYFGEDVNEYQNGKLTGHGGQWRLGRDTQVPGVLMPVSPKVGDRFKSEDVTGITHERDHVVSSGKSERIGGRTYRNVIRIRENAKPPPEVEYKTYSRGTGVLTEANGGIKLVQCR